MAHTFPRQAIQLGHRHSVEWCQNCGIESHRYKSGCRAYVVHGKVTTEVPACSAENIDVHLKYNVSIPIESQLDDATVIIKLLLDNSGNYNTVRMANNFLKSRGVQT